MWVHGGLLAGNVAAGDGGAIWAQTTLTVTIVDGHVTNNIADNGGGILVTQVGGFFLKSSTIDNNRALGKLSMPPCQRQVSVSVSITVITDSGENDTTCGLLCVCVLLIFFLLCSGWWRMLFECF